MKREIKFRGKRSDNTQWIYGSLMQYNDGSFYIGKNDETWTDDGFHNYYFDEVALVNENTIGQFTGLKDKNGKEIYEGDIIRAFMDFGPAGFLERIVLVAWHDKYGYQWNYFNTDTIEVIGNIHDNPELLKD